jgi:hypothetical protein
MIKLVILCLASKHAVALLLQCKTSVTVGALQKLYFLDREVYIEILCFSFLLFVLKQ